MTDFTVRSDATIIASGVETEYGYNSILALIGGVLYIFDEDGDSIDDNSDGIRSLVEPKVVTPSAIVSPLAGVFINVYDGGPGRKNYSSYDEAYRNRRASRPGHRVAKIVPIVQPEFLNVYPGGVLGNNLYPDFETAFLNQKDNGVTVALVTVNA